MTLTDRIEALDGLSSAITLAVQSHAGQVDKAGAPYILHPLRVMLSCQSKEERIAAVLHDTAEDCGVELGLIRHCFGDDVADAVDCLTRRDGETYIAFIERCRVNTIARNVKIADLRDNMDLTRLGRNLTEKDWARYEKYAAALRAMEATDGQ